jgi:hypothetical protein
MEPPWPTHGDPKRLAARSMFDEGLRLPWVTVRQALGLGGRPAVGRLDRPAPVVTTAEGKGVGVSDDVRNRRAGAVLFDASDEDEARIIAHRNATRTRHGDGAAADEPSVTVAANPPRLRLVSKRRRSSAGVDAPSVTVAADGREAFVRDGPAPTLTSGGSGRGGAHFDRSAHARRAWLALGIAPPSILDEPSGTLRAGTHGKGGWSPRHRAGFVVDADGPAPTLVMGGSATEGTPGGGGAHAWAITGGGAEQEGIGEDAAGGPARRRSGVDVGGTNDGADTDDAPSPADAPAQAVDSSGEWHRAGRHRPGEPSRGPRSRTILRRLTLAECARLQAFPGWFEFHGSKTSAYVQTATRYPRCSPGTSPTPRGMPWAFRRWRCSTCWRGMRRHGPTGPAEPRGRGRRQPRPWRRVARPPPTGGRSRHRGMHRGLAPRRRRPRDAPLLGLDARRGAGIARRGGAGPRPRRPARPRRSQGGGPP